MLQHASTPLLRAIDGTPGRQGVTFLYLAEATDSGPNQGDSIWLDAELAPSTLPAGDCRLLLMSRG
jgi:hypothetical protein